MKQPRLLLLLLVPFLWIGSAFGQLVYTSSLAPIAPFDGYIATPAFVTGTLLNLGSISTFTQGGLTFNLIPNLDPTAPSDLQVGGGFSFDVKMLAENHADIDNFGSEQTLLGIGNQVLYPLFGPQQATTWHITATLPTDLIFWTNDTSFGPPLKFDMSDPLHFRTFAASDTTFQYYIFAVDDRGSQLVDFNDGIFGARTTLLPVGITPVPEPSTYGMIGAGVLLGIVAFYRNRRKVSALA